jgi:hypothetical protein
MLNWDSVGSRTADCHWHSRFVDVDVNNALNNLARNALQNNNIAVGVLSGINQEQ